MDVMTKNMLLKTDIEIYQRIGQDGEGNKQYADTPTTEKGLPVMEAKLLFTMSGERVLSSGNIFIDGSSFANVKVGDLIKLPGSESKFPILSIVPYYTPLTGEINYAIIYLV